MYGIFIMDNFGLIAGVIAKLIMPGKDPGGWIITIVLGIAGAFIGGFIGQLIGFDTGSGFGIRHFITAIGGIAHFGCLSSLSAKPVLIYLF